MAVYNLTTEGLAKQFTITGRRVKIQQTMTFSLGSLLIMEGQLTLVHLLVWLAIQVRVQLVPKLRPLMCDLSHKLPSYLLQKILIFG